MIIAKSLGALLVAIVGGLFVYTSPSRTGGAPIPVMVPLILGIFAFVVLELIILGKWPRVRSWKSTMIWAFWPILLLPVLLLIYGLLKLVEQIHGPFYR